MTDTTNVHGTFRKLWPHEQALFRDHLLRLDKTSRAMRFAHGVSDSFIEDYARQMADAGSTVFAYVEDGQVRAAAELKKLGPIWGNEAEAAFSVESAFQDQGLGTEMMGRVIRAARNRGVHLLYISCLASNAGMQAIARKHDAELRFELGEVIGEIVPQEANYFSLFAEAVEDRMDFMMAVLDLQRRVGLAA
ncbi:GNAT family N-acetyltransferase [Hyphomicrobium sp.]|jgi:RimJ/RimL family protein N-acetyltransferase|uniref:GNAT family N-acetyltransferase n=1 Tax=Hyphomicrobium sp. TaxID=82 RepID=UPI0025C0ADC2|nr:GNAT family N-acetyltransferase [Hyphomicrobium sp.]